MGDIHRVMELPSTETDPRVHYQVPTYTNPIDQYFVHWLLSLSNSEPVHKSCNSAPSPPQAVSPRLQPSLGLKNISSVLVIPHLKPLVVDISIVGWSFLLSTVSMSLITLYTSPKFHLSLICTSLPRPLPILKVEWALEALKQPGARLVWAQIQEAEYVDHA